MSGPSFSLHDNVEAERITYFALTDARNRRIPFGIKKEDRTRHTYVIGKTGMGKSTLLENMAIQDIQNGEGLAFIDPHGGTAEKLLEYVPEERIKDVLYLAPFDLQYPVSFNVLEDVDADKRHLVVAGLMSTFEKLWADQWSSRMAYILQNTLGALLEFPGATILGVNRMYTDKDYRKKVIEHITDPSVKSFWVDEYSKYTDRYTQEATPAIQNKIGQFASNSVVRNIIGQPQSAFDIRKLMDEKKIFIVNLSKGRIGEGNANLLGSMLITKIYLAAMSRADVSGPAARALPEFFLHVDEFQNFANKSFADILSEARKYKLCLTIAHQYIEQMEEEVRAAVFGNVGTMITFRIGSYDAEILEKEFAPVFTADDLVNLSARQIYLKLMIDGVASQPFSAVTMPPIEPPRVTSVERVLATSRAQFSRPRDEVETEIKNWVQKSYEEPKERNISTGSGGGGAAGRSPQNREQGTRTWQSGGGGRTGTSAPRTPSGGDRREGAHNKPPRTAPTATTPRMPQPPRPRTPENIPAAPPETVATTKQPEREEGRTMGEQGLKDILAQMTQKKVEPPQKEVRIERESVESSQKAEPSTQPRDTEPRRPSQNQQRPQTTARQSAPARPVVVRQPQSTKAATDEQKGELRALLAQMKTGSAANAGETKPDAAAPQVSPQAKPTQTEPGEWKPAQRPHRTENVPRKERPHNAPAHKETHIPITRDEPKQRGSQTHETHLKVERPGPVEIPEAELKRVLHTDEKTPE